MRKFIVTDPCYIMPKSTWSKVCKEVFDNPNTEDRYDIFDQRIQEELRKFAGTDSAWAGSTGIGDWSNTITSFDDDIAKVVHSQFSADAGMVCVCELTPPIEQIIKNEGYSFDWSIAMFEVEDTSVVECLIDQSDSSWTVVNVSVDGDIVLHSEEQDEMIEDEEEDYYGYYEDEEE